MRTDSLLFIFFLVFMLGVFQNIAFEHYFYWKFWWYDVMMHFLGGAIVGSLFLWVAAYEFPEKMKKQFFRVMPALLFVLVVGVVWEIFEYYIGIDRQFSTKQWVFDSLTDLTMDLLGGGLAFFAFIRIQTQHG